MFRCVVLLSSPLLLAFAPVPIIRPMTDPDKAIEQFNTDSQARGGNSAVSRKRRLVTRMNELHATLVKRGKSVDAENVRERLLLVESMDADRPLSQGRSPTDVLKTASVEGKYRHLLHVLYVPADRASYSDFKDFGYWAGTAYLQHNDLKRGHWVYHQSRWFIWREGPPVPQP